MRATVLLASHHRFAALEPVLAEIDEARRALAPSGLELSVVLLGVPLPTDQAHADDGQEASLALAERLGLQLRVLATPSGDFGRALLDGFRAALDDRADLVVSLDADGQHDPRQIPTLVRSHIARRSGLTIGSRWIRGGSSPGTGLARSALSRAGNASVKAVTGARGVSDSTTSFRVYHPDVVETLLNESLPVETYGFFSAMVAVVQAHGFGVDEVPITFRPRYSGTSRIANADLAEFAASLPTIRRRVRSIRREMRGNQALWAQRNPRLRAQSATGESMFGATEELTNLADAEHFLSWISDELAPHLGARVLEVGAGVGAIAMKLAAAGHHVTAIEPADNVYPELARRAASNPSIATRQITSQALLADGDERFDSVVYVSVLEHIHDDLGELRTAFELLEPGGTIGLFVPAMPSLYGSLDFKSGHYRRYDRAHLESLLAKAGFEQADVRHMDIAGVVPYFLMYRLLDIPTLDAGSSKIYDSLIVPTSRFIQNRVARPGFGKNLLAVARRPADSCPPASRR